MSVHHPDAASQRLLGLVRILSMILAVCRSLVWTLIKKTAIPSVNPVVPGSSFSPCEKKRESHSRSLEVYWKQVE